ncbi:hypothetical protein Vadar_031127 [Vaccinium darrowii]|uniref:Uncharacterized protein n=1 Tax=Vaccinium darrowii TaxID=229202 RepID=A0ACB7Z890_9ERIC|nr:hypothetical protein Vadar_031127 [Vaccinium darrowii]
MSCISSWRAKTPSLHNVLPSDLKPCILLYDANYDLKQEMELSLVGLQSAGKTSIVNVFTVGFDMRKLTKGNVTIKLWDLGGQRRFHGMWEQYWRVLCDIVSQFIYLTLPSFVSSRYVVDAADRDSVPISRSELHELLTKPSLSGIPLHVLSNKIDKSEANSKQALMDQM